MTSSSNQSQLGSNKTVQYCGYLLAVNVRSSQSGASGRSLPLLFFTCTLSAAPSFAFRVRSPPFLFPERPSKEAGRRAARDAARALPSRRRVARTAASRSAAMSTRPPANTQSALSGGIGERAASHSQSPLKASAPTAICFCCSFPLLKPVQFMQ